MEQTTHTAECPIWIYQASSINWLFKSKPWKDEDIPRHLEHLKISEGLKIQFILSIASAIEGGLRNYLLIKVQTLLNRIEDIEGMLERDDFANENDEELKEDTERYCFPVKEEIEKELNKSTEIIEKKSLLSKECLEEELKQKQTEKAEILKRYSEKREKEQKQKLKEILQTFSAEKRDELSHIIDSWSNNDASILELIKKLKSATWSDLNNCYKIITNEKLRVKVKKQGDKLIEDLGKIFEFRNFFVHSNNIQLEFNSDNTEYTEKNKMLYDYLEKRNLTTSNTSNKKYFVEDFTTNALIDYLKKCFDLFFKCAFFQENPRMINLLKQVWKNDE